MQKENDHSIAVTFLAESVAAQTEAMRLATDLGLKLVSIDDTTHPFLLVHTGNRLELRRTQPGSHGPVSVDFTSGSLRYRKQHGGGVKEVMAKAVGVKSGRRPNIFDATAGLARDAFILASLGCSVVMCEQSPILASLLADGLKRGLNDPEVGTIISERLTLMIGNSIDIMRQTALINRPDTIYLDPMFPHRKKSALVKKEMQLLHELIGIDHDTALLLNTALSIARERVVVKRPRTSPPLVGPKPDTSLFTPNHRFDIYLTKP